MLLNEIVTTKRPFFTTKSVRKVTRQNDASRECLIILTPEQFLKLANPGHDQDKEDNMNQILDSGEKLNEVPLLGVVTKPNGDVEVASNGNYHEGRHRTRALQQRGVTKFPVRIISLEWEGPAYRWGSTEKRPKLLIGYHGYSIPFPRTYPYKSKAY